MATFTASAAQAAQPAVYHANRTITRIINYNKAVAFSAGDVVQMCKVPVGAIVTDVALAVSFSAGVVTVNIGDGNDVSAYAASVVLSGSVVALTSMPFRGLGRSYSVEDTIDIQAAAISSPPGSAPLTLRVTYICSDHGGQS